MINVVEEAFDIKVNHPSVLKAVYSALLNSIMLALTFDVTK